MTFGSEFLTCPELFPARRAGEAWGDRHVTLQFLGARYVFSGLQEAQVRALRNHFGSFLLEEASPPGKHVEIRLYRAAESDFREFPLQGWEYHLDLAYQARTVQVAGLKFMGFLEWLPELGGAVWTSTLDPNRFCEVCENFLRVAAQYDVLESSGLLVHSAALVIDDAAYLFPGRSGAGKSTLSRLAAARHWRVLSDELNGLSVRGGDAYVQQVPFAGDFGRTLYSDQPFPLAGIFRLRQGPVDAVEPLSPSRTLAVMLSCSPFVNLDPHRRQHAEAILETIVSQQRAHTLTFFLAGELAALEQLTTRVRVPTS